jgi:hypothetical protein
MVTSSIMNRLVGRATETDAIFEGKSCSALLDTGSMISTVSKSWCEKQKLQIQPLDGLLKVEGVGGQKLGYLGYAEASIDFPEIGRAHV